MKHVSTKTPSREPAPSGLAGAKKVAATKPECAKGKK